MTKHQPINFPYECGIYCVRCLSNGKFYIGASSVIAERLSHHRTALRGNRNTLYGHSKMQSDFNKYSEENFEFIALEQCEADNLLYRESLWINSFWDTGKLYNTFRPKV